MRNMAENAATSDLSPSEVRDALSSLTTADLLRLRGLAKFRAFGLATVTADDLVSEAIARILSGTRTWPRHVSLVPFVANVVRSIASEHRDRQNKEPLVLETDLLAADECEHRTVENEICSGPRTPHPESALYAEQQLHAIEGMFSDDEQSLAVILGRAEGLSPTETQKEFNMTKTEYESALKKVRRAFLKHGLVRPQ